MGTISRPIGPPRVHGNGFIAQDLEDGSRLHVWHHTVPRQSQDTSIHDHRFSFRSEVLEGTMVNVGFLWNPQRPGEPRTATHRLHLVGRGAGEETRLRRTDELGWPGGDGVNAHEAGSEYYWNYGYLHLSVPLGLTVTRIHKILVSEGYLPRVLCPASREPDNSWVRGEAMVPDWYHDVVGKYL